MALSDSEGRMLSVALIMHRNGSPALGAAFAVTAFDIYHVAPRQRLGAIDQPDHYEWALNRGI